LDGLIGNQQAKDRLRRMLATGRLPGTLLFAGPDGVGKKLFALELARALNCHAPRDGFGCGVCAVCRRIGKFVWPAGDDKDAHEQIIWSEHADVGLLMPYKRFLLAKATRDLDREAQFRPYEGAARVFIIEDAEKLNETAANSLLKTLEEPPATTHIILLTSRPSGLLPTIRSRCQMMRFVPLTIDEIERFLLRKGHAPADAALLSRLAAGSLGRALTLSADECREQRGFMLEVLQAFAVGNDRVRLLRAGEELNEAKRKDAYESHLEMLTILARDVWLLSSGASETAVVNSDLLRQLQPISARVAGQRAAGWLRAIDEHRQRLDVNINRKVALDALFLQLAR
jgi:DNA polymerase-3 subunit delta'